MILAKIFLCKIAYLNTQGTEYIKSTRWTFWVKYYFFYSGLRFVATAWDFSKKSNEKRFFLAFIWKM
jgi:hypothetical protein